MVFFIFNGLVVVFNGKSLNIEKECSLRFTVLFIVIVDIRVTRGYKKVVI